MIDRNHPAVEAARRALAADDENGCMIEQHEVNGMWTCLAHGVSADGPEMCWYVRDMPPIALNAAREQGWDDAAQHIYNKGWEGVTALRKANPYRPALSLPTDAFATNPPADADRPWEPLNGPVRVGDEVRQEAFGFAVTAVVARMDGRGDPLTAEGAIIGDLRHGTWYVRRPVQELPTEPGVVIVPADGHEYITATFAGEVYRAREAILRAPDHWHAAWRSDTSVMTYVISGWIDPGAWKVGNR